MMILLALLLDWFVGEPPVAVHPVVWFGNYLTWAERWRGDRFPILLGGLTWLMGMGVVLAIVGGVVWSIAQLPPPLSILLTGMLLKPAFAFHMLVREVTAIEAALQQDLEQGRRRLAYIVSRKTENLSAIEVRESALESISENLSDSVIAPLFWFLIMGLPGAYLYRFVNTADAMWGYRNAQYERWGKVAARMDDVMNWVPARITGLWLLWFPVGALVPHPHRDINFAMLLHEARKTPSPNSGWSMAAFALRLGVHLGKPGVYVLNPQGQDVDSALTIAGIRWMIRAGWLLALLIAFVSLFRFEIPGWLYG